jgi:hypothetical protein
MADKAFAQVLGRFRAARLNVRNRLKILGPERGVWVRSPPPAPIPKQSVDSCVCEFWLIPELC